LAGGERRTINVAMPLFNQTDLIAQLHPGQVLIGIDPGRKRIGVALSDTRLRVAGPLGQIPRLKLAVVAHELAKLVHREDAGGLVVGWPLEEDGTMGPAAQAVRDWARDLSDLMEIPATLWNERLSTATVEAQMLEANVSRARRAAIVDRVAAAHILQGFLDALAESRHQ
jgi:putative holliday junction resolvase